MLGQWTAVRVNNPKISVKDWPTYEREALAWNSIKLLPHHKFEAMFAAPMEGTWSIKGVRVMLKCNVIKNSKDDAKNGIGFTFKPDPIPLTLSQDGKSLTRQFDGEIIIFRKNGSK